MKGRSLLFTAVIVCLFAQAFGQTKNFYVSPTGNDSISDASNSSSNPFKTPNRAQLAITNLGACSSRTQPVVVQFETGAYFLGGITGTYAGPWVLGSGTGCSSSHVTFTNFSGAAPVISGGVKLTMTQVGSSAVYKAPLPTTLAGYSPEALFYNNTRRFRARPGSVSGSGLPGLVGSYYRVTQLTCGADPCFDRFQYTALDPPDSVATWANYKGWNPGGQPNTSPCFGTTTKPSNDGDIEILVFEFWTMSRERIACIDTSAKIVYLEGSTVQNKDSHGYLPSHRYIIENVNTGTATAPALLPGQFFIDRTASPFTLYYKAQTGETPNTANVVAPILAPGTTTGALVSGTGLQYVTFSNLQFSHDNYVPATAGFGALQSNTNLPGMVTCMNCSNTTFTGNTFTQTTGNALWFETDATATPTANSVTYNYFYDLGSDGLVYGDLPGKNDTNSNILQNGVIEENLVQGYGRMYAGASGLEHPFGSGTTIENNDVTDGYNSGIGVCVPNANINCGGTGTSGGTAIASNITGNLNHVWNIGKGVTDDMGAFYIATYGASGNQVENNRLHDVQDAQPFDSDGYGGNGVYIDNGTGLITVQNNLVYRVSEHTVQNTQGTASGQPNTIHNNILAYGRVAMFYEGGTQVENYLTETISNNIFYFDRVFNSPCGIGLNTHQCSFYVQAGCTVLNTAPTVAQVWNPNLYWNTSTAFGGTSYPQAFFTDTTPSGSNACPKFSNYTFTGWQGLGQEAGGAVFNPNFINPTCTYATAALCSSHPTQDNFQITGIVAGQTLTISPGNFFTAFSMSAPGRQNPTFTPAAILDTFPTLTFDTTTTSVNF